MPAQLPLLSELSVSGGSPFENDATTDPVFIGYPQSSSTCTITGCGQPAATVNPWPKLVKTGRSRLGVHALAARGAGLRLEAPTLEPAGAKTISNAIV